MQVNMYEAKTQLSKLVERAANGEEIIIAKAGKPVARLTTLSQPKRQPGSMKGQIHYGPGFDDPLPEEFLDYFRLAPVE